MNRFTVVVTKGGKPTWRIKPKVMGFDLLYEVSEQATNLGIALPRKGVLYE